VPRTPADLCDPDMPDLFPPTVDDHPVDGIDQRGVARPTGGGATCDVGAFESSIGSGSDGGGDPAPSGGGDPAPSGGGDGAGDGGSGGDGGGTIDDPPGNCPTAGCPTGSGELSLKYSARKQRFRGVVTSSVAACAPDRAVGVYRKRKGDDPKIANATTDASGGFIATKRAKAGKYYAMVDPRLVADSAGCAAARSPKIKVR
jgi:hypothetical protein